MHPSLKRPFPFEQHLKFVEFSCCCLICIISCSESAHNCRVYTGTWAGRLITFIAWFDWICHSFLKIFLVGSIVAASWCATNGFQWIQLNLSGPFFFSFFFLKWFPHFLNPHRYCSNMAANREVLVYKSQCFFFCATSVTPFATIKKIK